MSIALTVTDDKGKGGQYSITQRRVPELIPVLGSQPAGDVSHKPGGKLPLLSTGPAVTPATLKRAAPILLLGEQRHDGVNSLPNTVTRQRHDCDLNPGPSAPESSTLTTRPPSHPNVQCTLCTGGDRVILHRCMLHDSVARMCPRQLTDVFFYNCFCRC